MGRESLETISKGIVKRRVKRRIGLFIDATGLDRATRRLDRKVELSRLVSGLSSGLPIEVARYYTLIPHEDDARQLSFLDAVERAGLEVITKRLPPKGVNRQVSMDVHIATDVLKFAFGKFESEKIEKPVAPPSYQLLSEEPESEPVKSSIIKAASEIKRVGIIVCPSREISYGLHTAYEQGLETVLADFGLFGQSDGWRGVDRWIDLSTSETIWRD